MSVVVLATASLLVSQLCSRFADGNGPGDAFFIPLIVVLVIAGCAWAAALRELVAMPGSPVATFAVIAFSLALSASQLSADPWIGAEVDRSLLDGGVTACGENPYILSPGEQIRALATLSALRTAFGSDEAQDACLAEDPRWPLIVSRIEGEGRRSARSPLSVLWSAAIVGAAGPDTVALRLSYLMAHALALSLLAAGLTAAGLSPLGVAAFGWAPLVFLSVGNAAYDTVVAALMLAAAATALVSSRALVSAGLFGLACAASPFCFAPALLWLRAMPASQRLRGAFLFALTGVLPWIPFILADVDLRGLGEGAGRLFEPLTVAVAALAGIAGEQAQRVVLGGTGIVAAVVSIVWPLPADPADRASATLRGALLVVGTVIIVGPVGGPHALVLLLPLLAFAPSPCWLALIAAAPVYYLRYRFPQAAAEPWLLTAQIAPFALLALASVVYRNRSASAGRTRSAARAAPRA